MEKINISLRQDSLLPSIESVEQYQKKVLFKKRLESYDFEKINQIYKDINTHFNANNNNDLFIFLSSLQTTLKNNLFHIKGILISSKFSLYKPETRYLTKIIKEIFFNCDLEIRNGEYTYFVKLKRIKGKLKDKLNHLSKNTEIYITNLKTIIERQNNEENSHLFFYMSLDTKIYIKQPMFNDNSEMPSLNLDLTPNDEFDFIDSLDSSNINLLIKKLSSDLFDFEYLLNVQLSNDVFNLKVSNINSLLNVNKYVTICGIITKLIVNESTNNATIEISSLIDSNMIRANIYYCKSLHCDLKKNMVVIFNNYAFKLNNHYDLVIKNTIQSFNDTIGMISQEEVNKIIRNKKNILMSKKNLFTNLINLTTNKILSRRVGKYLIIIK